MNKTIIILVLLVISIAAVLIVTLDSSKQRFHCRIISDKIIFTEQQISSGGDSCSYLLVDSKNIIFEYGNQSKNEDNSGQLLLLNQSCHNKIAEKVSPIGTSFGPEAEKFVQGQDNQIYFCIPTKQV